MLTEDSVDEWPKSARNYHHDCCKLKVTFEALEKKLFGKVLGLRKVVELEEFVLSKETGVGIEDTRGRISFISQYIWRKPHPWLIPICLQTRIIVTIDNRNGENSLDHVAPVRHRRCDYLRALQ